jgi:uncharacterized membrane protein (DUF106 family)
MVSAYPSQMEPFHCRQTRGDLRLTAVKASSPLLVVMAATAAVVVAAVAAVLGGCIVVVGGDAVVVVVVAAAVVGIVARLAVAVVVKEHVRDMRKRQHPTWGMREAAIVGSRSGAGTSRAP